MKFNARALLIWAVVLASVVLMTSLAQQAPSWAQLQIMEYAGEMHVDYTQYPDCLVDLLAENPEAKDFVLNYPFRTEKPVDLLGYDLKDGVPLFIQWDPQWGYLKYGSELAGSAGSGPMCLAMAGFYLSGGDRQFYPDRMVEFADQYGYYSEKKGSYSTLITEGGETLGLKVTGISRVERKIAAYLKNGDPIIAFLADGEAEQSGHYVLLRGYVEGVLTINDPASRVNSGKLWDYDELIGQIRNLWVIQKAE